MTGLVRLARDSDSEACTRIYAPYVQRTTVSFEERPPSPQEMSERIDNTLKFYPWVLYEDESTIIGYAYAGQHSPRPAYRWSAEISVYVEGEHRRSGIGSALYSELLHALKLQGMFGVYAGIALPNAESVGFHESFGFRQVGTFHEVGFKFGRWVDVGWWQMELQPRLPDPSEPKSVEVAKTLPGWRLR